MYWLGDWDRCKVFFVVMVVKERRGSRLRSQSNGVKCHYRPLSCRVPHPPSTKNFLDIETGDILTFGRAGIAGFESLPIFNLSESPSRVFESLALSPIEFRLGSDPVTIFQFPQVFSSIEPDHLDDGSVSTDLLLALGCLRRLPVEPLPALSFGATWLNLAQSGLLPHRLPFATVDFSQNCLACPTSRRTLSEMMRRWRPAWV